MTSYNTGNPIGSKDPRDLYDNAENLDEAVNTRTAESWDDRFGVARKTWYGMEQDFQQFLIDSGYVNVGDYGPGLEITERNQIFWRDGELYRAGAVLELPYTTTGDWGAEEGLFVAVGDQALRQQLADASDPRSGAAMIAGASQVVSSVLALRELKKDNPSIWAQTAGYYDPGDGGGGIYYLDPSDTTSADNGVTVIVAQDGGRWKLIHNGIIYAKQSGARGDGAADDTVAIQRADTIAQGGVRFDDGVYRVTDTLTQTVPWYGNSKTYNPKSIVEMDNEVATTIIVGAGGAGDRLPGLYGLDFRGKAGQNRIHNGVLGHFYQEKVSDCSFFNLNTALDFEGVYCRVESTSFYDCNIGVYPRILTDQKQPSTMVFFSDVVFTSCDYGFKQETRTGDPVNDQNLLSLYMRGCGFEQCQYGLSSTNRTWYGTLENCWFEDNSAYGLHVESGNFIEINSRHSNDSPVLRPPKSDEFYSVSEISTRNLSFNSADIGRLETQSYTRSPLDYVPDGILNIKASSGYGSSYSSEIALFGSGKYFSDTNKNLSIVQLSPNYGDAGTTSGYYLSTFRAASQNGGSHNLQIGQVITNSGSGATLDPFITLQNRNLYPSTDNVSSLGTADHRWATVYAATGSINTSDGREKQQIRSLEESERRVATSIKGSIKAFKFNDAVAKKGDEARIHFGVIAQDVKQAFNDEGLDAHSYGVFCYDEWPETPEELDSEGEILTPYIPAGNRYGVRYDQLLSFIISAL